MKAMRATIGDVDLIAPLFDQYRGFYGQDHDLPGAKLFLEERLQRGESAVFVAVDSGSGDAAGFTQLYPAFSSISMRSTWILNDLFVREEYRGRGVGRLLLETARQHAITTGANGLSLSTAVDNLTAQRLYESFGFERDDHYYHYDLLT